MVRAAEQRITVMVPPAITTMAQQEADTTRAARYTRERDADVDKRDRELAEKEAELARHEHAFMELTTRSEEQME